MSRLIRSRIPYSRTPSGTSGTLARICRRPAVYGHRCRGLGAGEQQRGSPLRSNESGGARAQEPPRPVRTWHAAAPRGLEQRSRRWAADCRPFASSRAAPRDDRPGVCCTRKPSDPRRRRGKGRSRGDRTRGSWRGSAWSVRLPPRQPRRPCPAPPRQPHPRGKAPLRAPRLSVGWSVLQLVCRSQEHQRCVATDRCRRLSLVRSRRLLQPRRCRAADFRISGQDTCCGLSSQGAQTGGPRFWAVLAREGLQGIPQGEAPTAVRCSYLAPFLRCD